MVGEAMTLDRITTRSASGDLEALEFNETTGARRQATMTVCAFLNQGGGQVLFGVRPDGTVAGQQVSEPALARRNYSGRCCTS